MKQKEQKYTYDEIFQRNIGIFTKEEQERIKNLKVAIAGVGGLGAPTVENLVRLGVQKIKLAEPDCFEVSNLNRQTGAFINTIGINKAIAMKECLLRINPSCEIEVLTEKINKRNVLNFINGCDLVVDGIDFFNIDDEMALHEAAKSKNIPVVNAQGAFSIISFMVFLPSKSMLHELIVGKNKIEKLKSAISLMFPVMPKEIDEETINNFLIEQESMSQIHIPSYSVLTPLSGALMTQIIINLLIKKENNHSLRYAPGLIYIDNNNIKIERA